MAIVNHETNASLFVKFFWSFDHRPKCFTNFETTKIVSFNFLLSTAWLLLHHNCLTTLLGPKGPFFVHWIHLFSSLAKLVKTFFFLAILMLFYESTSVPSTCFIFSLSIRLALIYLCTFILLVCLIDPASIIIYTYIWMETFRLIVLVSPYFTVYLFHFSIWRPPLHIAKQNNISTTHIPVLPLILT